ncbi:MAG TPA: aspartate/glutamate racemase family protein [Rhodocyclaceae bacterium]|nr:aspartate/glutamate racemase family protein [Rhodocyclaceae bacterium]
MSSQRNEGRAPHQPDGPGGAPDAAADSNAARDRAAAAAAAGTDAAANGADAAPPGARSRIGIIAGSGPEAGVDLWAKVLRANRELFGARYRGDLDAPEVVVFSVPELGLSMELEQNDARVWACLADTATRLAAHVDYYGIACNTLNHYAPQLKALGLPARLVSVGEVVRDYVRERGLARVALLGARPVMDLGPWSPYRQLVGEVAVEVPADGEELHRIIYDVKARGGDAPDIVERFARLLARLESELVLLACTELPLIPLPPDAPRTVDVTELLAFALARRALTPPAAQAPAERCE